jgi:hypothetical protein
VRCQDTSNLPRCTPVFGKVPDWVRQSQKPLVLANQNGACLAGNPSRQSRFSRPGFPRDEMEERHKAAHSMMVRTLALEKPQRDVAQSDPAHRLARLS